MSVHANLIEQLQTLSSGSIVANLDAVDLTLILRSAGYQLDSFDFAINTIKAEEPITVEIKCGQSGIISKLSYKPRVCDCPMKSSPNKNSFWEVQGIAPASPQQPSAANKVKMTSTNLLPDIDRSWDQLTKNMLGMLCHVYKNKLFSKAQLEINSTMCRSISPESSESSNEQFSTPLSSLNITPIADTTRISTETARIVPKIIVTHGANSIPPAEGFDVEVRNNDGHNIFEDQAAISPTLFQDRDGIVIQHIYDARSKLDQALVCLMLSSSSDFDKSQQKTPTQATPPSRQATALTLNSVKKRRLSTGLIPSNTESNLSTKLVTAIPRNILLRKMAKQAVKPVVDNGKRPGTPRPGSFKIPSTSKIAVKSKISTKAVVPAKK